MKKTQLKGHSVVKSSMTTKEWAKAVFDKYLLGEISMNEMNEILEATRPKQLNYESEFMGYT